MIGIIIMEKIEGRKNLIKTEVSKIMTKKKEKIILIIMIRTIIIINKIIFAICVIFYIYSLVKISF
jgi:hypothetical protein